MTTFINMQQTGIVKRTLYFWFLFSLPVFSMAQGDKFDGDIWKGDYWRSVYLDTSGNKINVTRFYKGHTNEKERIDSIVEYKNGGRFESKTHFVAGDTNLIFHYYYDSLGQLRYERIKHFNSKGELDSDSTRGLNPRGQVNRIRIYDTVDKKYKTRILREGKWVETAMAPATGINENNEYAGMAASAVRRRNSFPKLELSAGYSYLHADNGAAGPGMPLGANLSGVYNLNSKLGLALDLSYHSGKKNNQEYDREYAMAGIQYKCNDCCCGDDPVIFTRALIGYGRDGYQFMNFKNSNSGLIAAIGAGLDIKINPKIFIQLKTDAIGTFFDDDMQIDYRAGLGVGVNLGRRSSSLNKNPYINMKRY